MDPGATLAGDADDPVAELPAADAAVVEEFDSAKDSGGTAVEPLETGPLSEAVSGASEDELVFSGPSGINN